MNSWLNETHLKSLSRALKAYIVCNYVGTGCTRRKNPSLTQLKLNNDRKQYVVAGLCSEPPGDSTACALFWKNRRSRQVHHPDIIQFTTLFTAAEQTLFHQNNKQT